MLAGDDADVASLADFTAPDFTNTTTYLQTLDYRRFMFQGADYTNPYYSATRLGVASFDHVFDFDQTRLAQVEAKLANIDRQAVLAALFHQITAGARNNTERHLRVLEFLHSASHHNDIQPMYTDGTMVSDPLVLLELGEMRCGQVNRLGVDLFQSVGYSGRMVQVAFHISAEVFYDGGWHLLEGDIFGGGVAPMNADGTIASAAEISINPALVDRLPSYLDPYNRNDHAILGGYYPAYYYASAQAYGSRGVAAQYYYRLGGIPDWQASKYYGWERLEIVDAPDIVLRGDLPNRRAPGAPVIEDVSTSETFDGDLHVEVSWRASYDADADVAGYRVFVATTSRGWNYDDGGLTGEAIGYRSNVGGWNPDHYELVYELPPSDVGAYTTTGTSIDLTLESGEYYVTVMAFDHYGQSVGRTLYAVSEEIRVASPPLIGGIDDLEISHNLGEFAVDVPIDAGSGDVAVTARVEYVDDHERFVYELDQHYEFTEDPTSYYNLFWRQEKWLRSNDGWFFIRPNGLLYKWTGHQPGAWSSITAEFVADVGRWYYNDPTRLARAAKPASLVPDISTVATVSFDEATGRVVVDPAEGFLGTFRVVVTATSGGRTNTEWFEVTVVNQLPEIDVEHVSFSHVEGSYTVELPAVDADGDTVEYSVSAGLYDGDAYAAYGSTRSSTSAGTSRTTSTGTG